jgi:predicted Zn-dependent protease
MKHRTRNTFAWLTVLCLSAMLPPSSVVEAWLSPAQAKLFSVSPEQERRMGEEAAREIESQVRIVSGPVSDWVNRVGRRLAAASDPKWKYSFKVIDRPEINAFALPGGYVYVFTGLRKVVKTDDELAAVLAHEITHAEQHHYARQYARSSKRGAILGIFSAVVGIPNVAAQALSIADFSLTKKYSRQQETESDILGMQRMVRAGFNPQGMVSLLTKLSEEQGRVSSLDKWFGDHPDGPKRVRSTQQELQNISQGNKPVKPLFAPWTTPNPALSTTPDGPVNPDDDAATSAKSVTKELH